MARLEIPAACASQGAMELLGTELDPRRDMTEISVMTYYHSNATVAITAQISGNSSESGK